MGLCALFTVQGLPIPQGHVRTVTKGGRTWSFHGSPGLVAWRTAVADAARLAYHGDRPWMGPVEVAITFHLPRPKAHLRLGGREVRPSAPAHVLTRPDVDRLARAVLDAISLGDPPPILTDDSLVVVLYAAKRYAALDSPPGVTVLVTDLPDDTQVSPFMPPETVAHG